MGPQKGLSTFDSIDGACQPGDKYQVIDTSLLVSDPPLMIQNTPPPDGHYSLLPLIQEQLDAWAATRSNGSNPGAISPYTQIIQQAIVSSGKRPK